PSGSARRSTRAPGSRDRRTAVGVGGRLTSKTSDSRLIPAAAEPRGPPGPTTPPHPGPGSARGLSGPPFAAEVPGRLTSKTWGPRPDQRPAEAPGGSRTSPRAVFREAGALHACSGTRRPKGPARVEGRLT
ncbi:unnamed protein product, partial [Ixodes persulcatus]